MDAPLNEALPEIPVFSDELLAKCACEYDYRPVFFEWYKYVGLLCNTTACLVRSSPAFRVIPAVHFAVMIGLLNRCSRLMLANLRLSSTGRYGETTRLIDRSIQESAIKLQWLCHKGTDESFNRYVADGLKKDFELKREIEDIISERTGQSLPIEQRMLKSIGRCLSMSGLSEQNVRDTKKLPDLASISRDLGYEDLVYMVIQRMGSHAIHGTWSELALNYLIEDDEHGFKPRDHEIETGDAQFVVVSRLVLDAMVRFLDYMANDPTDVEELKRPITEAVRAIEELQLLAWSHDFVPK